MRIYSCGNCGGTLSGPDVARCPHCGVLLRGVREGSEEERLRRQREYRRSRPEAIRRREKTTEFFQMAGTILGVGFVVLLCIGGGAALGWFGLTKIFHSDAAIPLAVGGGLFGFLFLQLVYVALFEPIFCISPLI